MDKPYLLLDIKNYSVNREEAPGEEEVPADIAVEAGKSAGSVIDDFEEP